MHKNPNFTDSSFKITVSGADNGFLVVLPYVYHNPDARLLHLPPATSLRTLVATSKAELLAAISDALDEFYED